MLRKILATLGLASASAAAPALAAPPYTPYASEAVDAIYNLLFCDDVSDFLAKPGTEPVPWQVTLASNPPDIKALEDLAADRSQEGRVRFLAYQKLRQARQAVPEKQLLGVIIEMPLAGGLDVLAAYSDGGVRYINQSGKIAVVEGSDALTPLVESLFAASQAVVNVIGPWSEARRPPPGPGNVRLSFLVSDGLYFGEGGLKVMQREAMAAPVIQKASELLQAVVAASTK